MTGFGARAWLDRIMAGRVPQPGRLSLTPMLSPKGRVVGDFSVARLAPERFLVLGADYMQSAFQRHFDRCLPRDGVAVRNVSADLAGLHICGPNAQALMVRIAQHDMDTGSFPFMSAAEMAIGPVSGVITLRVSFTGETGYEMYLPNRKQAALFDLLRAEGRDLGLGLVGTRSLMQTRLEKSFPAWGLELTPDYFAHECGMDRHINMDKPGFVGRDAYTYGIVDHGAGEALAGKVGHQRLVGALAPTDDVTPVQGVWEAESKLKEAMHAPPTHTGMRADAVLDGFAGG